MSIAALELGKTNRFSGLVRLPGGQFGRQKICFRLQALNMGSTLIAHASCFSAMDLGLACSTFPGRGPFIVGRAFFAYHV